MNLAAEIYINLILMIVFSYNRAHNNDAFTLDISETCHDNHIIFIHLPYSRGAADSRTILLHSVSSFSRECSIKISAPEIQETCRKKCVFLFVLEVFNYETNNRNLSIIKPGGIILNFLDGNGPVDVIADIYNQFLSNKDYILYSNLVKSREFEAVVEFIKFSGTIKMIFTAAKRLDHYENCSSDEIYCSMDGHMVCISKQLECDGNLNCGTPKLFDEYCYHLSFHNDFVLSLTYGTFLLAFVLFLIYQILKSCLPKVADHFFVYNEEQDYTFVLTSQSLPPIENNEEPDPETPKKRQKPTDIHVY